MSDTPLVFVEDLQALVSAAEEYKKSDELSWMAKKIYSLVLHTARIGLSELFVPYGPDSSFDERITYKPLDGYVLVTHLELLFPDANIRLQTCDHGPNGYDRPEGIWIRWDDE